MKTKERKKEGGVRGREGLDALVGEIAALKANERLLRAAMDQQLQAVRTQYEPLLAEREEALEEKLDLARDWCEANRAEFGQERSLALLHGTVGWRTCPPALRTLPGWDWDRVKDKLKAIGAPGYLRVKEEVNKINLLTDRDAIGPAKLREIGLRVVQEEAFFIDVKLSEASELIPND